MAERFNLNEATPWDARRVVELQLFAATEVLGGNTDSMQAHYKRIGARAEEILPKGATIVEAVSPESASKLIRASLNFLVNSGTIVESVFIRSSADAVNAQATDGLIDPEGIITQSRQASLRKGIALHNSRFDR